MVEVVLCCVPKKNRDIFSIGLWPGGRNSVNSKTWQPQKLKKGDPTGPRDHGAALSGAGCSRRSAHFLGQKMPGFALERFGAFGCGEPRKRSC